MKLNRIATANQLGEELGQLQPSLMLWIILAIASFIIGSILVIGIPVGWGWAVRVPILGLVLLLLVPCFLGGMLWSLPMRLGLYERGLIYKDWKSTKVILWNDIQSFSWKKPEHNESDVDDLHSPANQESFTLQLRGGDRFEVPIILDPLDQLHTLLQAQTTLMN